MLTSRYGEERNLGYQNPPRHDKSDCSKQNAIAGLWALKDGISLSNYGNSASMPGQKFRESTVQSPHLIVSIVLGKIKISLCLHWKE